MLICNSGFLYKNVALYDHQTNRPSDDIQNKQLKEFPLQSWCFYR